MLDNAIHRIIDHYPLDNSIGFPNTYPLDSAIQLSHNWGQFFTVNIQNSAEAYFPFVNDRCHF